MKKIATLPSHEESEFHSIHESCTKLENNQVRGESFWGTDKEY